MQLTIIIAIISALAALAAGVGALWQAYLLRFSLKVQALFALDQKFNAPQFRRIRAAAARSLRDGRPALDVDEVIGFLDTLGLLLKRRTLDKEMVWHMFFYWIHGYSNAARDHLEAERRKN